MSNKNTRGSEWRKWDLHVHTPESGMANEFSNWDSYVKALFSKAIKNNIAAIGITDYFTIDGYKKIKEEYLQNDERLFQIFQDTDVIERIKHIKLFPNIEFRIDIPIVKEKNVNGKKQTETSRVNYHIIFSDEISITDIEENFLQEIDFVYEGVPFDTSNTRKLKKTNIECNREKVKREQPTFRGNNFEVGCSVAVVSNKQINDILKSHKDIFDGKYLIVVPVDEDLSDIKWESQGHMIRKPIYQESNMFFSSNENTRDFGLGKKHKNVDEFIQEFKSLKPCIHGSDAHAEDKLFQPDNNRYCWIKADPTFEGLKQILYEPEDRVRIQESKPEEKSIYHVIDSVNFDIDKKWKGTIQLNPNLNTIIGGRATGKSTLLKAIAKKISDDSFKCKDDTEKDFLKEYIENISISWLDGQDSENRDIEMLPQGNMYDIARDTRKLDELIQRIIKDTEYNKHIENYESKKDQCKKSITSDIQNLFSLQKQIKDMELSLREKGDKKGIKAEIDNLAKRIEELNKGIGVSDEELKQFQENKNKITDIEQYVKQFGNDLSILKELKEQSILVPNYSEKFIDLSADVKNSLNVIFQELKAKIDEEWRNKISNEEATLSEKIQEQRKSLNSIQNSELFKKCKQTEGNNKELNDAEEKLKEENGKLKDFEEIEKQLEERNKLKKEKIESIVSSHISYKTNIQELVEELKIKHDDVEIKTTFCFTNTKFRSFLEDRLNQRGFERQNYIKSLVDNYPNETETACREFLCKALNGEIEYKNYNSNQSVVIEFFATNWFDYSFDLTFQNDTFSQMSDGKKAFVVLKLLLEFSNKKCPILIDQPEDSLDNRAIYNDLVTYIRKKKTERQIILVTHNPNIVVGADAENVIVANQHGTDSLNEKGMKFQYVNGSLEYTKKRPKDYDSKKDLVLTSQGIREHVCEILEGGEKAFQERENKYGFTK